MAERGPSVSTGPARAPGIGTAGFGGITRAGVSPEVSFGHSSFKTNSAPEFKTAPSIKILGTIPRIKNPSAKAIFPQKPKSLKDFGKIYESPKAINPDLRISKAELKGFTTVVEAEKPTRVSAKKIFDTTKVYKIDLNKFSQNVVEKGLVKEFPGLKPTNGQPELFAQKIIDKEVIKVIKNIQNPEKELLKIASKPSIYTRREALKKIISPGSQIRLPEAVFKATAEVRSITTQVKSELNNLKLDKPKIDEVLKNINLEPVVNSRILRAEVSAVAKNMVKQNEGSNLVLEPKTIKEARTEIFEISQAAEKMLNVPDFPKAQIENQLAEILKQKTQRLNINNLDKESIQTFIQLC